jgi:hypothetical protein
MIPNARNSVRNKEKLIADKLSTMLSPIDIDMQLVAFHLSTLPALSQLRLCDLVMTYIEMAKDSDDIAIKDWANSLSG